MSNITLDLATKVIQPSQNIWSVFPGTGRRLLEIFASEQAVFLEMPAIKLSKQVLSEDKVLRQHVAMSLSIAKWYQKGSEEKVPSRTAASYPVKNDASFNAAVANVRNLFDRAQKGDLVLVGGKSLYAPILIGEIAGDFNPQDTISYKRYANEKAPIRRVHWFPKRVERRSLSEDLSHLLSNRRAVITIDKKRFGDQVYRAAYGDYVFGSDARYIFNGDRYNNIALSTVPAIDLLSYFAAAFHACDINELNKFSIQKIENAVKNYFEQDILYSFEISFASPGNFVLHAKRAALPLLVAVLVAATCGTMTYEQAKAVEITNSANSKQPSTSYKSAEPVVHADGCLVEVQEKYRAIMNTLGADRYNQLCDLNKEAQDGVGLRVDVQRKK